MHEQGASEHPINHTGQIIALIFFGIIWITDSFFLKISTISISIILRLFLAIVLIGISIYLHNSVHRIFEKSKGVIITGPFKYVRNPLYLAGILFYLGLTISTMSLLSFGILIPIFLFYNQMADYEEERLIEKYGEEYLEYKRKTGRWLPKF